MCREATSCFTSGIWLNFAASVMRIFTPLALNFKYLAAFCVSKACSSQGRERYGEAELEVRQPQPVHVEVVCDPIGPLRDLQLCRLRLLVNPTHLVPAEGLGLRMQFVQPRERRQFNRSRRCKRLARQDLQRPTYDNIHDDPCKCMAYARRSGEVYTMRGATQPAGMGGRAHHELQVNAGCFQAALCASC